MKKLIVFLILNCFFRSISFSQINDIFKSNREYHYIAVYIDSNGDTITKEKLILKPTGKQWLFQLRKQITIKYQYLTDTSGYKNYIDPEEFFHKKNKKFLKKKGKPLLVSSEKTGASIKEGIVYMHPPRTNQYRMLQYSAHPFVYVKSLTDSLNTFSRSLGFIGMGGDFKQKYVVKPLKDTTINNSTVKAWNVSATSGGDFNDYFESLHILDSRLNAIFTKEYGFIKLHYTFENNIKIQFDLEEIVYK